MPIKLPKGLKGRRKSSAQALDELANPPQGTFHVLEREHATRRSAEGFSGGKRLALEGRPVTFGPQDFEREQVYSVGAKENRKSAGTIESYSTGRANQSAASSMRLSSASTNPSSTDLPLDGQRAASGLRKSFPEISSTPRPSGRSLFRASPGNHMQGSLADSPGIAYTGRERAATASTTSTATPPRLLDSEFALGSDMDDFGNMFEALDKKDSRDRNKVSFDGNDIYYQAHASQPAAAHQIDDSISSLRHIPSPNTIDRSRELTSSPFSWSSQRSDENLIGSSSPQRSPLQQTPAAPRPLSYGSGGSDFGGRNANAIRRTPSPLKEVSSARRDDDVRGWAATPTYGGRHEDRHPTPDPALEIADSVELTHNDDHEADDRDAEVKSIESILDPSLVESMQLATVYENVQSIPEPPKSTNKVMTPAQFERYRREQELRGMGASETEQSEDEQEQDEEDEDEIEKARQAQTQRRKQEAKLAVYRQQMRRVTGDKAEPPSVTVTGPQSARATRSAPNLTNRLSPLHLDPRRSPASGRSSEGEDEDEDVPLGILAAHGFPSKGRPPSQLANFRPGSGMSVRSESQVNLAGSGSGASTITPGPQESLPAFARKLPQDPYFGAGLISGPTRESFALGGGAPNIHSVTPPGLPPGGLVGVIAGEERARALRRGSPNAQAAAELPAGMQQQFATGAPGMVPYGMSPHDQAQLQMQAQMNNMMQMQMQWMQQMQFMVMQGQPQGNPLLPSVPSLVPQSSSMTNLNLPAQQQQVAQPQGQRPKSMMTPQSAPWTRPSGMAGFGGGLTAPPSYAPSIAPSERSNIGLAPRYRPVSVAPPSNSGRTSTMKSATPRSMPPLQSGKSSQTTTTVRAVAEDDEDDRAWAEMKRKREERKMARKYKKGQQELASLYHDDI